MRPHLTPTQIRSLATRYVAARSEPGAHVRLPSHLHRCDRCLEAFTDDLSTIAWLRTSAVDVPVTLRPRRPRPAPPRHRRLSARRPAMRAVACLVALFAAMVLIPRGVGDADGLVLPDVQPASLAQAEAAATTEPSVLRLVDLPSAAFAIRRANIGSTERDVVRMSVARFVDEVLPRLDPVDQWRAHQTVLASVGLYPSEHVDGLYGERTRAALREFFGRGGSTGKPQLNRGLLSKSTAIALFGQFGDVAVAIADPSGRSERSAGRIPAGPVRQSPPGYRPGAGPAAAQ